MEVLRRTHSAEPSGGLDDVIRGARAGLVATLAMSVPMLAARRVGLIAPQPPEVITARVARRGGMRLSGTPLDVATSIAHLAFGGAAGGLYALATGPAGPVRAGAQVGSGYGALIWAMAYLGVLPRLRLVSSPGQGGWTREIVMLSAHLVYGAVLGRLSRSDQSSDRG